MDRQEDAKRRYNNGERIIQNYLLSNSNVKYYTTEEGYMVFTKNVPEKHLNFMRINMS